MSWEWVKGHAGHHDNEVADRAADLGRRGLASTQSRRWQAPPAAVRDLGPLDWDICHKCGEKVFTRELRTHYRQCSAVGRAIPAGQAKCRLCSCWVTANRRSSHESWCRGTEIANRRCEKCGRLFPPPPRPDQVCRARDAHESGCDGMNTQTAEEAAALVIAPPPPLAPVVAARGKAKPRARARGRGAPKALSRGRGASGAPPQAAVAKSRGRGSLAKARARGRARG